MSTDGSTADEGRLTNVTALGAPSFEDYKLAARTAARGDAGFVVESDMFFERETDLRDYYEHIYGERPKSIINLSGAVRDVRPTPKDIRYCFAAGWGQNQGGYVAPALAPVQTAVQSAMSSWEKVANIRFRHVSGLDGASCTNSGANPGVDFVVQHYDDDNSGIAKGPFPSNSWSNQKLQVPESGISRLLAIHEVGHALGFRHEHTHSGASPRCSEGGTYEELTEFDTLSCMKYSNCNSGAGINGTEVSVLDGLGARMAYGLPDWAWPTIN